jgi:2-dehydro-3-deoxyphosphogluconate aldolase/(4S)-4-hydroxy-2-oxoglutarate aldolase
MNAIFEELGKIGIVPVVKIDDAAKAVPLVRALAAGGIPCAEITFRTAQGAEAIRRAVKEAPELLIGAGTVLTTEQVDRAIDAGARFIVSPGLNPKVVAYCLQKKIPMAPGCATPSDMELALEMGLEVVKYFPAEPSGLEYIKAISAPFPALKYIPTGGINTNNMAKYITFEKVLACGGSWMVTSDLINAGEWEKITALSREAVFSMLGFTVAHIGINAGSDEKAEQGAQFFSALFGCAPKEWTGSILAGNSIEIMRAGGLPAKGGLGAHGHIAMGTNSVTRAAAWLERNGIALDHASAKKDPQGNVTAIYLKEEILGFAVHLVRKAI